MVTTATIRGEKMPKQSTSVGDGAAAGSTRTATTPASGPVTDPTTGSIIQMRARIDEIDAELVRLIKERNALSHEIGTVRASEGGTRIVYSREMTVLDRFADLGPAGTDLGMLLLSMGRGKLGRR